MSEKFFLGGVTPNGFSTQLGEYVNSTSYFTYILKGGAGTGKSTLMKKLADHFEPSENVTRYFCSSDPESLDAVVLHSSKTVVIDGTAPHVFDPKYPGVCQRIFDLGFFWNKDILLDSREAIVRTSDTNKRLLACASDYAKALGKVCEDSFSWGEFCLDEQKLTAFAQRFCKKLFGKRHGLRGRQQLRQLSALTMYGYITLSETLENYLDLYCICDDRFCGSDKLIRFIAQQARAHGYDVKLSPCLLFEDLIYEHLLIDEIGVAILSSSPLTHLEIPHAHKINMTRFYDKPKLISCKHQSKTNISLIRQLSDLTAATMMQAKQVHDELESHYIKAMDFDGLDRVCETISGEIAFRGKR